MKNVVTFRVGRSRYAVPAEAVAEVAEIGPVTHHVLSGRGDGPGLTFVRGRWVPVIELAGIVPEAEPLGSDVEGSVLLLLGGQRRWLGLRVQELGGIVEAEKNRAGLGRDSDTLLELNGELVRYVDPAVLLDSRADLLGDKGGSMEENQAASSSLQVVAFRVCDDEFAIDVMNVFEVLKATEVRTVPRAPDFVEGVLGVRDSVIPVIDMRKRFSLPERGSGDRGRLLVVATAESRVALVVDDVPGVVELPQDAVSPAPDFFRGLAGRYLYGVARHGERLIILLNMDEILTSKERIALEKMVKGTTGKGRKAADPTPTKKKRKKRASPRAKKKKS